MSIMAVTAAHHSELGVNTGSVPCLMTTTDNPPKKSNLLYPNPFSRSELYKKTRHHSIDQKIDRNETVVINISGKRFETYLTTLRRFPNTLLGDPEKLVHFYNEVTGEYFFDRHRKAFSGILYFYQSNGIVERPAGISESLFTQEALFFELSKESLKYEGCVNSDLNELIQLPSNPYLCKMWILFEQPNSSFGAKIVAIISVIVIVLSIVIFCIESIPSLDPEKKEGAHMWKTWLTLNSVCNIWFTIEYFVRFICAPEKLKFVRSYINIIDLVSIIPYYVTICLGGRLDGDGSGIAVLKVIRIFRVVRVFKLTRHSRGLYVLANTIKSSSHELFMLGLFLIIGVILFSSAIYYAESHNNGNDKFKSIPAAFWWAVVTMTTVGYGDLCPETVLGKCIGGLCAVSGVLVIALPVPVIVSNFEHYYKQEQCRQAREEELFKKLNQDGKFSPMKQTMKMMAQASIVLAGGQKHKETVTYNPRQQLKEKIQTKISFHLQQQAGKERFTSDYDNYSEYSDDADDVNYNTPMVFRSSTSDICPQIEMSKHASDNHLCNSNGLPPYSETFA